MSRKYRILFLTIFSIFFIVTTPFLVLYSLGYDLNLSQGELSNSLTITVDTRPRIADIYSNEKLLLRRSGELRANEKQLVPLSVKQNGYLSEDFLMWSGENQNTTARITNLWLLPTTPDTIDDSSGIEFVSLLSKDLAVIKKDDKYFVQLYSFGGLQGNPEPITSSNPLTRPVISSTTRWEIINDNAYWDKDNEFILVRQGEGWKLFDTRFFVSNPKSVAYLSTSELIFLDYNKNLWVWNYTTNQFRFLESKIDGLTFTEIPDYIWVWRFDTVYRINPNRITDQLQLEQYIFTSSDSLSQYSKEKDVDFNIKNVYQGIFIHFGSELAYIPDYNKNDWYTVASNVRVANGFDNSIVWLDDKEQVWLFNLQLKNLENITQIPELDTYKDDEIKLFYYFLWRRVVIYTPTAVHAIWYDKDILNKNIVGYNDRDWIEDMKCYSELIDRYQFCIDDGKLLAYKNTSIW